MSKPFKYLLFLKSFPEQNPLYIKGVKYRVQEETEISYILSNKKGSLPISKDNEYSLFTIGYIQKENSKIN